MDSALRIALVGLALFTGLSCSGGAEGTQDPVVVAPEDGAADPSGTAVAEEIEVPAPPFSAGVFPCSDCHDPEIASNTRRRTLTTAHQEVVLRHDAEHRWCLDCHSASDRDKLHLAGGELVEFGESYRLCGQCHGDKYRDWRAGVHGRRSGDWDGHKTYLLCVNCHNAHDPAFRPIEPMPPPRPPTGMRP